MLTETAAVAAIAAVPGTIAALATLIVSLRNGRKVEEVHRATNSMKDALVLLTEIEAHARGRAQGVVEERERRRLEDETL